LRQQSLRRDRVTHYGIDMKDSAKAGLEQFLTYRLHVLNKLAERGISERYQARLGVTLPEARVIASVGSFGPFSIMELARHANLDKSQASRAAEAMIRQGLVQRQPSADDGRVVLVSLTPEGRALYRKVMPIARKWNDDMFDCLDEREKVAFSNALDKIIETMTAREP
jgi:DNA-binding MarR family transcriptional regulator